MLKKALKQKSAITAFIQLLRYSSSILVEVNQNQWELRTRTSCDI